MDFNVYSCVLHICCFILAGAVVFLSVMLKKSKNKLVAFLKSKEFFGISVAEKELLDDIERGFKNDEFKMYLQFIVDNKTKKLVSAEALSRWEKADGEIIFPGKYISVMEKAGIITKLDYYMFEKASKKLSEWQGTEFEEISISCNFTRYTISEDDFVTKLRDISERYSFDKSKLIIEITEDSIEKNLDVAIKNILWARELGFSIALDDIGNGYTSLVNLCEYPLDIVKIDREILYKANKERGKKLFFGIISLAHYLNLKVVCEGVETEEQNSLVFESDCDYIQGWYYSKGLPENDAEAFAKEYTSKF